MPELLILGHNAITQASFTTVCLYIWFNTNAFVEYLNIIDKSLGKFTKERNETLEKYYKQKELSPSITYPEFLAVEYNNFFTELISCPICLGVWINIVPLLFMETSIMHYFPSLVLSFYLYFSLIKLTNGE